LECVRGVQENCGVQKDGTLICLWNNWVEVGFGPPHLDPNRSTKIWWSWSLCIMFLIRQLKIIIVFIY